MTAAELDVLLREADEKIDLMEAHAQSREWVVSRERLEKRKEMLQHQQVGLLRRLGRPVKDEAPVTAEQLAFLQGRIEENDDLINFPRVTVALWRQQREELSRIREARA